MKTAASLLAVIFLTTLAAGQVPIATHIKILKAEDERRYDDTLATLLKSPDATTRIRAALASGRIGDEAALPLLHEMLKGDASVEARAMAAFAIGEIESIRNAYGLLDPLKTETDARVRSRIIEAAGKMAAANPTNAITPALKRAILDELKSQTPDNIGQDEQTALLALTAALRARPEGSEETIAKFLDSSNSRIVADAANTLARIRAKNSGEKLRRVLRADPSGAARSNAARALGAAEDKGSSEELLKAALVDSDSRVRVSALRSLVALRESKPAKDLIDQGRAYLIAIDDPKGEPGPNGTIRKNRLHTLISEVLEIATTLGRLLPNTENEDAIKFLRNFRVSTDGMYPEIEIALARIGPKAYVAGAMPAGFGYRSPRQASAYAQGLATVAETKDAELMAQAGRTLSTWVAGMATGVRPADEGKMGTAMPDVVGALAALKPQNLNDILLGQLKNDDPFLRASVAGAIADLPATPGNIESLKAASIRARLIDKHDNDAKIAILDALEKLDKKAAAGEYLMALSDPDYVVRKKAIAFLGNAEVHKELPGVPSMLASARSRGAHNVKQYTPIYGTKLGQVLNTDVDYRRALLRKNGTVKAVLTTEKGAFTIEFFPEDAPLTVDNFVKLARAKYFDGLEVHRVVPNFVMQDGDPRGDGNGGPGWSIRCEMNMRDYDRGAVGMALSGKDTGGSQWFVTHSPQPHLDGGYTVFGRVIEADMKVVDKIVRGDKILSVKIVESVLPRKGANRAK